MVKLKPKPSDEKSWASRELAPVASPATVPIAKAKNKNRKVPKNSATDAMIKFFVWSRFQSASLIASDSIWAGLAWYWLCASGNGCLIIGGSLSWRIALSFRFSPKVVGWRMGFPKSLLLRCIEADDIVQFWSMKQVIKKSRRSKKSRRTMWMREKKEEWKGGEVKDQKQKSSGVARILGNDPQTRGKDDAGMW